MYVCTLIVIKYVIITSSSERDTEKICAIARTGGMTMYFTVLNPS